MPFEYDGGALVSQEKTVGTKLLKHHCENLNTTQQTGETREAMDLKMRKELDDIIQKHHNYADKYFVVFYICTDKTLRSLFGMYHVARWNVVVRKTCPPREPNMVVFSYDNRLDELRMHFVVESDDPSYRDLIVPS